MIEDESYYISKGLSPLFKNGIVHITSIANYVRYAMTNEYLGREGELFTVPADIGVELFNKYQKTPWVLEKMLSLPRGSLGKQPVLIEAYGDYEMRLPRAGNKYFVPHVDGTIQRTGGGLPEGLAINVESPYFHPDKVKVTFGEIVSQEENLLLPSTEEQLMLPPAEGVDSSDEEETETVEIETKTDTKVDTQITTFENEKGEIVTKEDTEITTNTETNVQTNDNGME